MFDQQVNPQGGTKIFVCLYTKISVYCTLIMVINVEAFVIIKFFYKFCQFFLSQGFAVIFHLS